MSDFGDVPLAESELGRRCYVLGRRLVDEAGIRPRTIMWDADETLWDWLMSASEIATRLPWYAATRTFAHRELFLVRPGILELLYGMKHAAEDAGDPDPWMRIWTNGYPWRLWQVALRVPALSELLGPTETAGHRGFVDHPRVFYCTDFVRAARVLAYGPTRERALANLRRETRRVILDQLSSDHPLDSNLKLPELAQIAPAGEATKPGFSEVEWLVDDRGRNIKRFMASRRRGVRIVSRTPYAFFGKLPNTTWGSLESALRTMSTSVTPAIAEALLELSAEDAPASRSVESRVPAESVVPMFSIDVDASVLTDEWLEPMRVLRRESKTRVRGWRAW